jgi:hypothetical protein
MEPMEILQNNNEGASDSSEIFRILRCFDFTSFSMKQLKYIKRQAKTAIWAQRIAEENDRRDKDELKFYKMLKLKAETSGVTIHEAYARLIHDRDRYRLTKYMYMPLKQKQAIPCDYSGCKNGNDDDNWHLFNGEIYEFMFTEGRYTVCRGCLDDYEYDTRDAILPFIVKYIDLYEIEKKYEKMLCEENACEESIQLEGKLSDLSLHNSDLSIPAQMEVTSAEP